MICDIPKPIFISKIVDIEINDRNELNMKESEYFNFQNKSFFLEHDNEEYIPRILLTNCILLHVKKIYII